MSKVTILQKASEHMTPEQRRSFENYFIGAIAALSSLEDWESAIRTALRLTGVPQ